MVPSISPRLCFKMFSSVVHRLFVLFFSELIICLFLIIEHTVETRRRSGGHNCCACQSSWTFTEMSFRDLNFRLLFDTHVRLFSSGFWFLSVVKAQQMPFSPSFIPILSLFSIFFIHPKPTDKKALSMLLYCWREAKWNIFVLESCRIVLQCKNLTFAPENMNNRWTKFPKIWKTDSRNLK